MRDNSSSASDSRAQGTRIVTLGIAAIIGPTIGGALASGNDYSRLLTAVGVLLMISIVPAALANRQAANDTAQA